MRIKQFIAIGLMVVTSGSLVIGFSAGPPDGVTNAPGEVNCTACHLGNPLNMAGGTLSLTPSAAQYVPGETLNVVINLARNGQARWGFELTSLSSTNTRLGKILDTSTFTQLSTGVSRSYLKHVSAGTFAGTPNASPGWGFRWVAPAVDSGPVTFYIAGNAANNSGFNDGDFIYATSLTVPPAPPGPCCLGGLGNVDCDAGESVDLIDLTVMVDHLFISFASLCCTDEADLDTSGGVDLIDLTLLVDHLFITFTPLANCP